MKYQIKTQITEEPVSLNEARTHLRIEPFGYPLCHPDDAYIQMLVSAAREWAEQYTRRALATQTINFALNGFPEVIDLPIAPLQSVSSIKYLDINNVLQTLNTSVYYIDYFDSKIYLNSNQVWPSTSNRENSVIVEYVAGYTNEDGQNLSPLPFPIKAAILLMVGSFYENRQEDQMGNARVSFNSLPLGVYNLLQPYRLNLGV